MANIMFFEGFNYSDSDTIKLDPSYWSYSDSSKVSFSNGRTNNGLKIDNRPPGSGISSNYTVTLSNFSDPLATYSGFCLGYSLPQYYQIRTNSDNPPLYQENLVSFHDNVGEVLRVGIIKTSYSGINSLGLGIYQNNILIDTYDFKNVVGSSWNFYDYGGYIAIQEPSYIEVYVDSKNINQINYSI